MSKTISRINGYSGDALLGPVHTHFIAALRAKMGPDKAHGPPLGDSKQGPGNAVWRHLGRNPSGRGGLSRSDEMSVNRP
jgi:hypothetical protein